MAGDERTPTTSREHPTCHPSCRPAHPNHASPTSPSTTPSPKVLLPTWTGTGWVWNAEAPSAVWWTEPSLRLTSTSIGSSSPPEEPWDCLKSWVPCSGGLSGAPWCEELSTPIRCGRGAACACSSECAPAGACRPCMAGSWTFCGSEAPGGSSFDEICTSDPIWSGGCGIACGPIGCIAGMPGWPANPKSPPIGTAVWDCTIEDGWAAADCCIGYPG
mmetsp:Transcript_49450/g.117370  ORF Transcript_49450/g.117370 Transcript_49450/m.117370 type:complete len:217 (+) Transcript_49450:81-731(+)